MPGYQEQLKLLADALGWKQIEKSYGLAPLSPLGIRGQQLFIYVYEIESKIEHLKTFDFIMTDVDYIVQYKDKPTPEQFGWVSSCSFDEQSGWQYEGGEEAFIFAMKKYEEENG